MTTKIWAVTFGILVMVVDALTKVFVHLYLPHVSQVPPVYPYGGIPVFENILGVQFSISHMTNTGAAWGAFGDFPAFLLGLRALLIVLLIVYFLFKAADAYAFPLALIIAGALGNVIDTAIYGHVVDMLQFKFWGYQYPWFNLADTSIFLGVCSLAALTIKQPAAQ